MNIPFFNGGNIIFFNKIQVRKQAKKVSLKFHFHHDAHVILNPPNYIGKLNIYEPNTPFLDEV
jgi:hypothetical protein